MSQKSAKSASAHDLPRCQPVIRQRFHISSPVALCGGLAVLPQSRQTPRAPARSRRPRLPHRRPERIQIRSADQHFPRSPLVAPCRAARLSPPRRRVGLHHQPTPPHASRAGPRSQSPPGPCQASQHNLGHALPRPWLPNGEIPNRGTNGVRYDQTQWPQIESHSASPATRARIMAAVCSPLAKLLRWLFVSGSGFRAHLQRRAITGPPGKPLLTRLLLPLALPARARTPVFFSAFYSLIFSRCAA